MHKLKQTLGKRLKTYLIQLFKAKNPSFQVKKNVYIQDVL